MSEEKKLNELKEFIEEQRWYIQTIAKDKNINLEIVRSPLTSQTQTLNARLWAMVDVLEMIQELEKEGETESQALKSQT